MQSYSRGNQWKAKEKKESSHPINIISPLGYHYEVGVILLSHFLMIPHGMPPTYEFVVIKLFNFSNEICLNMKLLFYSFVSKGPNREMHYINYKGNCKLPAHL